ncbi:MAG: DUF5946 family protein, partial [Acidobacteriota bacterium]
MTRIKEMAMPRDPSKFIAPDLVDSKCTECGAEVPDEFTSCFELFMSILTPLGLRLAESPGIAMLYRLIVDTGAMQHPRGGCKSAKSYAAHLTGLCCGVEYNGSKSVRAALQRWLNGSAEAIGIIRPTEPDDRGVLTIRYVYDAATDAEVASR